MLVQLKKNKFKMTTYYCHMCKVESTNAKDLCYPVAKRKL